MVKSVHELRDPVHVFVRLTTDERKILDSRPFQRLRQIHQLALTYLVYPGATHRRFEHSLGVMELAGRIFDVICHRDNLTDKVRDLLPEISSEKLGYWRQVVRMAALCHDIGHLPFSHGAEKDLLHGKSHEDLTALLIRGAEMAPIWRELRLHPDDVAKLALGPKEAPTESFSTWETILSEIIVGDAFGADRMDYLLRDSLHAGVAYGRFDHFRLIDTLRILTLPPSRCEEDTESVALGVEEGGLQSAEALLFARYFMYSQLYFHSVRRIYDIHLKDFMIDWLAPNDYPFEPEGHLDMTDVEVLAAMRRAERDPKKPGHSSARAILCRKHFKPVYTRNPDDTAIHPEAGLLFYSALSEEFGATSLRHDRYAQKSDAPDFPVLLRGGQIASSLSMSEALRSLPVVSVDTVYVDPQIQTRAESWLQLHRDTILHPPSEEDFQ